MRSDVPNAVREVERQTHDPSAHQWKVVLRIFEHLRETPELGIVYWKVSTCRLVAFADSSNTENKEDNGCSVSGGVVLLAGAAVSPFSRTQHCVTLSSTESEYVSLSMLLGGCSPDRAFGLLLA